MIKKLHILILLTALSYTLKAQNTFATVSVYPKKVYVGQSAKLTIKVYTTTWFTKGVEFEKMKIDGAFLVPYQRNLPFSTDIKGKQYTGVEFFFLMIPYKSGNIVFPQLKINIVTPPEGDYKGKNKVVRTREIKIKVEDVPPMKEGNDWYMLANSIYVSEKWNKSLNKLKTGDVLVRTVRVRANATLPNFIPELKVDSLAFASIYPDDFTTYEDKKTENIYGVRTDKIKYLLTKEGEFTFPDEKFYYFNPRTKKVGFKTLKGKTIKVELNKDLAYAQSVQDSLDAFLLSQIKPVEAKEKKEFLILGMKPWKFISIAVVLLYISFKVILFLLKLIKKRNAKRKIERLSEKYLFNQMQKKAKQKSFSEFHFAFNKWKLVYGVDKFNKLLLENQKLNKAFNKIQKLYSETEVNNTSVKEFVFLLKEQLISKKRDTSSGLNP